MTPEELLTHYESLIDKLEIVQAERELIVKKVLETVAQELKALDKSLIAILSAVASAKEAVEVAVLDKKETVSGEHCMAVWNKGRESWDGSKLNGFAMAHPEILQAKKIGEPTVSFRKITKKDK